MTGEHESKEAGREPEAEGEPQVYAVQKDLRGWRFNRRDFIAATGAAAAALAGATLGCGTTPEPTATPLPTRTKVPTPTPTPTATPPPTLSPEERARACAGVKAHQDRIHRLLMSRDGTIMVSSSADGIVKLWSLPEGALIKALEEEEMTWAELVEVGPEKFLACRGDGHTMGLWSLPEVELAENLQGQPPILAVTRPGGTLLAFGGETEGTIHLWSLEEGELVTTLEGHTGKVWALKASPDGTLLASAGEDGTVRLWSLAAGALLKELEGHTQGVWDLWASPDGALLVSGGLDDGVRLWSLPEGELIKTLEARAPLAASSDGTLLATLGPQDAENTIRVWSLPEGELIQTLEGGRGLAMRPDGTLLVSSDEDEPTLIKLWSLPEGELIRTLDEHTGDVWPLVVSPDGALLASGDMEGCVKLWSFPQGGFASCLMDLGANESDVEGVTYKVETTSGQTIEYTLPCGAPIPPGAVCVCNCVAGSYAPPCTCVGHTAPSGGHYWYPC